MNLLKALFYIFSLWRKAFCKDAAFIRAKELAICCLCSCGRKTITNMAIYLGRDKKLPIADYKFYSECKWNVEDLFNPIFFESAKNLKDDYISCSADDTKIRKTGKKIPNAGWGVDPLGPKFQTNLIWNLRFLQISILLPLYEEGKNIPTRSIPIRFVPAPSIKKPGKKGTESDWKQYQLESKQHNLSTIYVNEVKQLRKTMDANGLENKKLIISTDGSYCNKTCMAIDDPRIIQISRCRTDAKLCFPAPRNGRKKYGDKKFTPEEVRKDESIPWQEKLFFYGGKWRIIRFKEVKNVLWQNGTKMKPLRLIVLAPLPYVKGGRRHYRRSAYLLTTSVLESIEILIQSYLDRWQIEYNHRDEKSILGVGEAQVRNEYSVWKQPAFHVACYSALLLANIMVYRDQDHPDFGERPSWRKKPKRNTCRALIGLLRATVIDFPVDLEKLGITIPMISTILRKVA